MFYQNFTPAPLRNVAFSSSGHLGFAGWSNSLNCFSLNFSNPTIAIIAALSPQNSTGGNKYLYFSFSQRLINIDLIFLLAATPPAITNIFFFWFIMFFKFRKCNFCFL